MTQAEERIMHELSEIRKDLDYIKKHLIDADCLLSESDIEALEEYRKEKKAGTLTSHDDVKKELGL